MQYHISDCKKYNRCPRLFHIEANTPKAPFQPYIRVDEEVSDLACRKLHIEKCFKGQRGDEPARAIGALKDYEWLTMARFAYDRLRVKVPFLHKRPKGWDLYFLYIGLYPRGDDLQFYGDTLWVLAGNNIPINDIYVIHLNAAYVRQDELDPEELFVISPYFYNKKNHPGLLIKEALAERTSDLTALLNEMDGCIAGDIPDPERLPRCAAKQKCRHYEACFPEESVLPDNSVINLSGCQARYDMAQKGITYLKDADIDRIEGTRIQYAEIMADRCGGLFVDRAALKAWMDRIKYPITFLDFEWECFAIPPYKGMRPFQTLPFEYSVHIMDRDGHLEHKSFLSVHDDRLAMAKALIRDIPESGSLVCYNADGAEKLRIGELAEMFPQYRAELSAMNDRMEDLQLPFAAGLVYDIRMRGQWSLKAIMALMNDKSYTDLNIHQGMEAVFQWRHLDRFEKDADRKKIRQDLEAYCGMDSYAESVVFLWLKRILSE